MYPTTVEVISSFLLCVTALPTARAPVGQALLQADVNYYDGVRLIPEQLEGVAPPRGLSVDGVSVGTVVARVTSDGARESVVVVCRYPYVGSVVTLKFDRSGDARVEAEGMWGRDVGVDREGPIADLCGVVWLLEGEAIGVSLAGIRVGQSGMRDPFELFGRVEVERALALPTAGASGKDSEIGLARLAMRSPSGELQGEGFVAPDGRRVGVWTTYHPNGSVESQSTFVDGRREGVWCSYFNNGVVEKCGLLALGRREGTWVAQRSDGSLKWIGSYRDGKAHGQERWWNKAGQMWTEGRYKQGWKIGRWSEYWASGGIHRVEEYGEPEKGPVRNGVWLEYYESGAIKARREYDRNSKVGTWREWAESGEILSEVEHGTGAASE